MHRTTLLAATATVVLAAATTTATPARAAETVEAWGVAWQPTLNVALRTARKHKRPVLLMRVLGDLRGKT